MLTRRILPPDEWPKLQGTEAETLWPLLNPDQAAVLVVEQDGQIVGCWVAMQTLHAECVWVSPTVGNPAAVARPLIDGMFEIARGNGMRSLYTSATNDEVREIIRKLHGTTLPGTAHVIPVPREEG
jgi:hypothetical protein